MRYSNMRVDKVFCFMISLLFIGLSFLLFGKEGKKKDPVWNMEACRRVTIGELTLTNPNLSALEGRNLYLIGKYKGTIGNNLDVEGASQAVFSLKTEIAKKQALIMNPSSNIVIYGRLQLAGQLNFKVYYLEQAPSFREICEAREEKLSRNKNASYWDWEALANWAKQKGIDEKDPYLMKKARSYFAKSFLIRKNKLDPENPSQVEQYVELVKDIQSINQDFTQMGYGKLRFPIKDIFDLVQIILKHQPDRADIRNILFNLGYYPKKGRFRPYDEFKQMEGFIKYQGSIKDYSGKWVSPLLLTLLKTAETRIKQFYTLRQPPSAYEKAIKNKTFLIGMDKREVVKLTGFPKKILRISLKKYDDRAGVTISTKYEIWKYGIRKDQYLCFEEGNLFYFPPTFAPLKK